jgi:alkylhydroperoxidase family enzyme
MDHEATRETLELAALEPGGIDRLKAGDTAAAQAVAAHLAGCPACTDELARLGRASRLIAAVVREAPPADLRERTLGAVRELGRPRHARSPAGERPGRPAVLGWVAAIAAAVVLSIVATSMVVGWRLDQRLAAQADTIQALEGVTTATARVTAEPDARHVVLTGTSDPGLDGHLVFSPSTSELVVVATGLTPPPDGQEYRCWVERGGGRQGVGKMFFSKDLAYWIGPVPAISGLSGDATFGVSLVDASGSAVDANPVLRGGL